MAHFTVNVNELVTVVNIRFDCKRSLDVNDTLSCFVRNSYTPRDEGQLVLFLFFLAKLSINSPVPRSLRSQVTLR